MRWVNDARARHYQSWLTEADAEKRFQLRAQRGAGKETRGLELLERAAGHGPSGGPPAGS